MDSTCQILLYKIFQKNKKNFRKIYLQLYNEIYKMSNK